MSLKIYKYYKILLYFIFSLVLFIPLINCDRRGPVLYFFYSPSNKKRDVSQNAEIKINLTYTDDKNWYDTAATPQIFVPKYKNIYVKQYNYDYFMQALKSDYYDNFTSEDMVTCTWGKSGKYKKPGGYKMGSVVCVKIPGKMLD